MSSQQARLQGRHCPGTAAAPRTALGLGRSFPQRGALLEARAGTGPPAPRLLLGHASDALSDSSMMPASAVQLHAGTVLVHRPPGHLRFSSHRFRGSLGPGSLSHGTRFCACPCRHSAAPGCVCPAPSSAARPPSPLPHRPPTEMETPAAVLPSASAPVKQAPLSLSLSLPLSLLWHCGVGANAGRELLGGGVGSDELSSLSLLRCTMSCCAAPGTSFGGLPSAARLPPALVAPAAFVVPPLFSAQSTTSSFRSSLPRP